MHTLLGPSAPICMFWYRHRCNRDLRCPSSHLLEFLASQRNGQPIHYIQDTLTLDCQAVVLDKGHRMQMPRRLLQESKKSSLKSSAAGDCMTIVRMAAKFYAVAVGRRTGVSSSFINASCCKW